MGFATRAEASPTRRELEGEAPFETWQQLEAVAAQLGAGVRADGDLRGPTGLRPSELFGLDRRDVDRQLGVVYVRPAYANGRLFFDSELVVPVLGSDESPDVGVALRARGKTPRRLHQRS